MSGFDTGDIDGRLDTFGGAVDNLMRFDGQSGFSPCRVEASEDIRAL